MSKAIIAPSSTPSRIALEPERPFSQSVRPLIAEAIGEPTTTNIRKPTAATDSSGITTTGMMPLIARGTFQRIIHSTRKPAARPDTMPPRKPAPTATETAPPAMPAASAARSAIAQAMYPERIGTRKPNEVLPVWNSIAAQLCEEVQSKWPSTEGAEAIW